MDARREVTAQAIAQLQQIGSVAVKTLRGVMEDVTATPAAKVTAAKAVLEMSMKAIELEDLAENRPFPLRVQLEELAPPQNR